MTLALLLLAWAALIVLLLAAIGWYRSGIERNHVNKQEKP